jgi:hypothetical protein
LTDFTELADGTESQNASVPREMGGYSQGRRLCGGVSESFNNEFAICVVGTVEKGAG